MAVSIISYSICWFVPVSTKLLIKMMAWQFQSNHAQWAGLCQFQPKHSSRCDVAVSIISYLICWFVSVSTKALSDDDMAVPIIFNQIRCGSITHIKGLSVSVSTKSLCQFRSYRAQMARLCVSFNQITLKAVPAICKLLCPKPNLKELDLNGNWIHQAGVDLIRKQREKVGHRTDFTWSDNEEEGDMNAADESADIAHVTSLMQKM
eukprot:g15733.t1